MVVPYKEANASKKEQIRDMFDNIAPKYDFLNHFLTVGIDRIWRAKVCKIVREVSPEFIMDMASGTGDLAIQLSKLKPTPKKIVGLDISDKMLEVGREKAEKKKLSSLIEFKTDDAENINSEDEFFDAVTCAFGVRNFEHIAKGLSEFHRVIKQGGRLVILELSVPENRIFRGLYNMYFNNVLPFWGRLFSKDKSAYSYLPESVANFPAKKDFLAQLSQAGFRKVYAKSLSFGIATIFVADK